MEDVSRLAAKLCPDEARRSAWGIRYERGILIFESLRGDPCLLDFLRALITQLGCEVADGTMRLVQPSELNEIDPRDLGF
ncbi:MAG TPA: hypothetical protein VH475_25650 [Tepidisphaeraceae bacterium]|jgi:hypothetical protein